MKKKLKAIIATMLVVSVGIGGLAVYRHINSQQNIPHTDRVEDLTETVQKSSFITTVTASGSVELDDEIEVYAEGETNIIKNILVEEGDTVNAGDLLVEYDVDDQKEELETKIRDTKREIENAQLSLDSMTATATATELTRLENSVSSKQKALTEAQTNYNSYASKLTSQQNTIDNNTQDVSDAQKSMSDTKELLEVGGATQSEYDSAVTALNKAQKSLDEAKQSYNDMLTERENAKLNITTAQNDLTDAQNELADAKTPLNTEEEKIKYKQQQLTLQGLQDNLSDYQKDLSELVYSTSSTVSGKVTEVCVDEGTYTEENTVILKVANFNNLVVSASIEEYDAPLIAVGQSVVMTSDGLEGKEYKGKVTKVNSSAEDTSTTMGTESTVPVEISVDNPDGILKPGYNLDLEITVLDKQDVLTVSSSSVQSDAKSGTKYVYSVENNTLVKKEVATGETNDTSVEIISGLEEGNKVIKTVNENVKEGITLDELKTLNQNTEKQNSTTTKTTDDQMPQNGGMPNDQNRRANQNIPSGAPGGGGFGGGGPMG